MRRPEEKMLRLVKERNVWGVVQLFSHQQVETILNLRRDLCFAAPREIMVGNTTTVADEQSKIKSVSLGGVESYSVEARGTYHEHAGDVNVTSFTDLKLFCLVIFPFGHPLDKFGTILDLLEGCCDAIKGHRSLYLDGKVLHQDASKDNIVIPDVKKEGEPRGVLIDLDLGMELAVGPTRPGELIGTKAFMAIDLLTGTPHTYRHDLESFLYVFLWIAICGGHKRLPPESRLQRWQAGSWIDVATRKAEDMLKENFNAIVSEFSPAFAELDSLAYRLREILFLPSRNGALFTGTRAEPDEVERLYDGMINAFEVAASSHAQRALKPGKT
jgi:hypothetical protein